MQPGLTTPFDIDAHTPAAPPPPPPPFDRLDFSRPCVPEQRPHTVHASSSSASSASTRFVNAVGADQHRDDHDSTPRASAAALDSMSRRRMSRDDTANDMHLLGVNAAVGESTSKLRWPAATSEGEDMVMDPAEEYRLDHLRLSRRVRKPLNRLPLNTAGHSEGSHEASNAHAEPSKASIGRRLSRQCQERVSGLRENFQRYASLPGSAGRCRRSSTTHGQFVMDEEPACIDPKMVMPKPPTSPSKRSARQGDERPRKHRHFLNLRDNDRKDTPAPTTYGLPVRPASSRMTPAIGSAPGGDAARKAAALHNTGISPTSFASLDYFDDDDSTFPITKGRIGSLESAADSGADLSNFGESDMGSIRDVDGDVTMSNDQPYEPSPLDPLHRLPNELSSRILELLSHSDILCTAQVSRRWNAFSMDNALWRTVFLRDFERRVVTDPAPIQVGGAGIGRPNRPQQQYRNMYKARVDLNANWKAGSEHAGKAIYLSGHTDSVYCLQFDEEKIITGSRDRTIRVWDINTYQCLRVIGGPNVKPTLGPKVLRTVDYPSFHMATASVNGTAYGDGIYHTPKDWHDASILCLQYDEEILVTGSSDSDLLVWDVKTYEPIKRLKRHTGGVLDVALDAKHIVSCSKDSKIIVWDRETLEYKGELTGHRGPVNAVQLRGSKLVSASGDGIARLWDLNTMKLAKEFSAKERGLAAVEFSEDMQHVLAGGNDNITYKFETESGREVKQFTGHTQLVRSLWLDSANNRVVSGSYDLNLRVYDFESGQLIWNGDEWTTSWMLAAKSDYRRIVATSQDGRILIVDFGIYKGAPCYQSRDGMHIPNIDLLRGIDHTNEIKFINPFANNSRRREGMSRRHF